jgi:cholinesterase
MSLILRGAMSIADHLVAYGGRNDNLFRAAILESGGTTTQTWTTATSNSSNQIFDGVVTTLGCASAASKLACLRDLPYATIYDAFNPANNGTIPGSFPVIDGSFFVENPVISLTAGRFLQVPTIIGHNDDEGALFVTTGPNTTDELTAYLIGASICVGV